MCPVRNVTYVSGRSLIFLVSCDFRQENARFPRQSALLAGEPNQENEKEECLTVQIPPLSLVGAWVVRFFDARESCEAPKHCLRYRVIIGIQGERRRFVRAGLAPFVIQDVRRSGVNG
jgi:hypothetical protein